jgi:hypothetical protein
MGCTTSQTFAAFFCEYPASGYNCYGCQETLSPEGKFDGKWRTDFIWKGDASKKQIHYPYVFPMLNAKLCLITLKLTTSGSFVATPSFSLELIKPDGTISSSTIFIKTRETEATTNLSWNQTLLPSLISAEAGDIFRLKVLISDGTACIKHLIVSMTSEDQRSPPVRLSFEEFVESSQQKETPLQTLSLRSYRTWYHKLLSGHTCVGFLDTPSLILPPVSMTLSFDLEILTNTMMTNVLRLSETNISFDLHLIRENSNSSIVSHNICCSRVLQPGINKISFTVSLSDHTKSHTVSGSRLLQLWRIGDKYQLDRTITTSGISVRIKNFQWKICVKGSGKISRILAHLSDSSLLHPIPSIHSSSTEGDYFQDPYDSHDSKQGKREKNKNEGDWVWDTDSDDIFIGDNGYLGRFHFL